MEQPRNIVGGEIRRTRDVQGMSQQKLAAQVAVLGYDLTRGTLAKIEAGIRGISDVELFLISRVLKVEVQALYPKNALQLAKLGQLQPFHKRKAQRKKQTPKR